MKQAVILFTFLIVTVSNILNYWRLISMRRRRELKIREAGEQGTGGGRFWPPVPSPQYTISCEQKQFRISRTFTISQQGRHELDLTTTFRQLCRAFHDHQGPKSAVFNVQYLSKAMLDYSETSENVYLAFNQHIGLNNKKFKNLVHLTFKAEAVLPYIKHLSISVNQR